MAHRYLPLALVLSASLLMGCTLEIQSGGAESPPPPPPPPPGQTDQPAAQPATAPAPPPKRRLKSMGHALGAGDKKADDPNATEGTLKVQVVDGTCDIKIDGETQGTSNGVEKKVAVGTHEVSCTPAGGTEQKHSAEVTANETTTVAFSTKTGTSALVPKK